MNTVKFTLKTASGLAIVFSSPATASAAGVILACTVVAAGISYGGYWAYKHYANTAFSKAARFTKRPMAYIKGK